ncbi:hypothetical protein GALL_522510 [mine drainage metagenome]|uniref:Uncharacterized protein n=1 Tax=mine drainage metagenome TaxID=410659 RepID=A0A1J5P624_9ZZZZ
MKRHIDSGKLFLSGIPCFALNLMLREATAALYVQTGTEPAEVYQPNNMPLPLTTGKLAA